MFKKKLVDIRKVDISRATHSSSPLTDFDLVTILLYVNKIHV